MAYRSESQAAPLNPEVVQCDYCRAGRSVRLRRM
jgi:hypothetical protein